MRYFSHEQLINCANPLPCLIWNKEESSGPLTGASSQTLVQSLNFNPKRQVPSQDSFYGDSVH
ncbi:hypothetical protein H8959_018414 [Pygathrix nigripes]